MATRVLATPPGERMCDCGHKQALHTHHRRGTDCALCTRLECSTFQPADRPTISWPRATAGAIAIIIAFACIVTGLCLLRGLVP